MNFIERHGLVQYKTSHFARRFRIGTCEWCTAIPKKTYMDHCHKHGWIRGEVCHSHSERLKRIDGGRRPELWAEWMVQHWLRCPECVRDLFAPDPSPDGSTEPEEAPHAYSRKAALAFR